MNKHHFVQASVAVLVSASFVSAGAQTTASQATSPAAKASGARTGQATKAPSRSGASNTASPGNASASKTSGSQEAAVLVLLPVAMTVDNKLGEGCWVRFYDEKNFRGANLTLVGPMDMPRMDVPGPAWREWDSAIVGPKARVTTYDNENYNDRTATLAGGQHIPDLNDNKLGWFEEVHSAKVACSQ